MSKGEAIKRKMPTTIIIIRHGETELNKLHKIRGWSDVPLSKDSEPGIKKTGKELKGKVDFLVSSDLDRCVETAKIISAMANVPIKQVSKNYRPWNVGEHTGEPQDKVYQIMADYAKNDPDMKIPGGESFNNFKDRFLDAIKTLKKSYPGECIGVVTHHRGDRIFAAWHKEGFPENNDVKMSTFLSGGIDPGTAAEPVEI